ncbi:MAG: succinate dehydrogenase assembly factor 2 [Arenicella sp.]
MNPAKLKWRCRRGVRELDVLFTYFIDNEYEQLSELQQEYFDKLLDIQDPIIMDWLFARSEPDESGLKWIIEKLQTCSGNLTQT